jgi:hypothetical protein
MQNTNTTVPSVVASGGIESFLVGAFFLAIVIFCIAGVWRTYSKAGHPGWTCLIPIYNTYVWVKMASKPGWWVLLMFIPVLNVIFAIIVAAGVARNFGKGIGFTIGMIIFPFIFLMVLGFGDSKFNPVAEGSSGGAASPAPAPTA